MSKHILFVEDEAPQQDLFETALKDWNGNNPDREFSYRIASNYEDALEALDRERCESALFDLRVRGRDGAKAAASGADLARKAMSERGIPVAIISANTGELDDEFRNGDLVQVFDKNDGIDEQGNYYDRALAWLGAQWEMLDVLGAARKEIDSAAADIFLRRLWPRWNMFAEIEGANRSELVKIVARQYAGHIADLMGLEDPANVSWHPFENYVSPSLLAGRAHTGDIFRLSDELWIVLTPQCDMATQKVDNVILARCKPGIEQWTEMVDSLRARADEKSVKKSTKFLTRYVNQNLEASSHFLPPLPGETDPLIIKFSDISAKRLDELNGALDDRIASVSSPFLANLVQRYGAYVSRMGQPNIDVERF